MIQNSIDEWILNLWKTNVAFISNICNPCFLIVSNKHTKHSSTAGGLLLSLETDRYSLM